MNSEVTEIGLSLSSTRISQKMGVEGVEQDISSFFGILDALNPCLRGTCKTQNQNFGVPALSLNSSPDRHWNYLFDHAPKHSRRRKKGKKKKKIEQKKTKWVMTNHKI